jgi:peptidoglycan/xylan/chitin deacetylase (PgdA/CDA1 family)
MTGTVLFKHALKWSVGRASLCWSWVRPCEPPAVILMYHRVAPVRHDWTVDNWNVAPDLFAAQVAMLVRSVDVVDLRTFVSHAQQAAGRTRPLVTLTFDDGYAALVQHVLPVLQRWRMPATFFLPTAFVGSDQPMPFDRWAARHPDVRDAWRPLGWGEVEQCIATGLVSFGSHSHRHLPGDACSDAELEDETARSRDVLLHRLGDAHAFAYAYPYGSSRLGHVSERYVRAAQVAGFEVGVTTNLGAVEAGAPAWTLPRVEACAVDAPAVLEAKCRGALEPLAVTEALRRRRRWRDSASRPASLKGAAHVRTTPS